MLSVVSKMFVGNLKLEVTNEHLRNYRKHDDPSLLQLKQRGDAGTLRSVGGVGLGL